MGKDKSYLDMSDLVDILAETDRMTDEELEEEARRDAEEARQELARMRAADDLIRVVSRDMPADYFKKIYAEAKRKKEDT